MNQNGKIAIVVMIGVVAAAFGFSLYVLLTTKNTIIVVNEAVNAPIETVVTPPAPQEAPPVGGLLPNARVQVLQTDVGFLNVRNGASTSATKVGTVKPGDVYEYTEVKDNWYHIAHPTLKEAWVFGQYVKEVDRSTDLFGS